MSNNQQRSTHRHGVKANKSGNPSADLYSCPFQSPSPLRDTGVFLGLGKISVQEGIQQSTLQHSSREPTHPHRLSLESLVVTLSQCSKSLFLRALPTLSSCVVDLFVSLRVSSHRMGIIITYVASLCGVRVCVLHFPVLNVF